MTDATLEVETQGEVFCFYFETKKESYPWRGKFITVPEIRAAVGLTEHEQLVSNCLEVAQRYGLSLILVTHPRKAAPAMIIEPSLDALRAEGCEFVLCLFPATSRLAQHHLETTCDAADERHFQSAHAD